MDWEAILRPTASSFCVSVKSWLKEDLIEVEEESEYDINSLPDVEIEVGRTFRTMITALKEATNILC